MRASSLIFGVIIASLFMGVFGLVISDLTYNYGVEYNDSQIQLYNKLNDSRTQAFALQSKLNDSQQDTGITDVLGGILTKAVESLKLTYTTMGSSVEMVSTAQKDLNLPSHFLVAFTTIIIVFIILGVIISAMVKKDV